MVNPRLIELAKRYANDKIPERKIIKEENLSQLLKYENGVPRLNLTPLEETVVNTQLQKDYDTLMQVYEVGGWSWSNGVISTEINFWDHKTNKTCIRIKNSFEFDQISYYQTINVNIISPQEFYETQNISKEMLKELNQWFDTNKPNRKSKG